MTAEGKAAVVGIGMIGGSIASALRKRGWEVFGYDIDASRMQEALDMKIIDHAALENDVAITFVATPVSAIADAVRVALNGPGLVTDVGSVKGAVCDQVSDNRFIGGHPMTGSDVSGLAGVDAELFHGATWVLTPDSVTSAETVKTVTSIINSLGADTLTLPADSHDEMVATISHVPHVTASALMTLALDKSLNHDEVLQLAAGGFRDMTRIAAGHPQLWTDIVLANKNAIVPELHRLANRITEVANIIDKGDRDNIHEFLALAAKGRKELPLRSNRPSLLAIVRVPIPDKAGALGEVLSVFGSQRVNVEDLDIAHDTKGDRGVLQVTISRTGVEQAASGLQSRGFRYSVENI